MLLKPDFTFYLKGIRVRRYDLTQHNPNAIPMPTAVMDRDSMTAVGIGIALGLCNSNADRCHGQGFHCWHYHS